MTAAQAAAARIARRPRPVPAPAERPTPAPRVSISLVDYHLSGHVFLDYVVRPEGHGGLVVRVHFPDDTRSLLESLSWNSGRSILSVLDGVARLHLERVAISGLLEAATGTLSHGEGLTGADAQTQIPLAFLRASVSATLAT